MNPEDRAELGLGVGERGRVVLALPHGREDRVRDLVREERAQRAVAQPCDRDIPAVVAQVRRRAGDRFGDGLIVLRRSPPADTGPGATAAPKSRSTHGRRRSSKFCVTLGADGCFWVMSFAPTRSASFPAVVVFRRFEANIGRLVVRSFSPGLAGVCSLSVRSQQLCSVAGPLWAPPHSFANGNAQLA